MINLAEFGTKGTISFPAEFRPVAKYIPAMDCLIYLREDVSYRAVRLDPLRTVLLHPKEDRPIGVKLKGMRFVMEKARAVFRTINFDFKQARLITLWEMALTEEGDEAIAAVDLERKRQYGERAKELLEGVKTPLEPTELPFVA